MDFGEWRRIAKADLVPGLNPNRAARFSNLYTESLYDLLFIEYDDQGRPFLQTAVADALAHIEGVAAQADPIIIVFVHGWKHSARDDDENVRSFHRLLHAHAHAESLSSTPKQRPRRVVGLYVGWRGLTFHWLNVLQNLTFWGRKEAALRVALGSVRELFARLRKFRLSMPASKGTGPRLLIAGHSFGGLVVYSAMAEYLIESVAVPKNILDPVAPFGDLTILVNPAFEAARYYPLHSILSNRKFAPHQQVPVFMSITAENDWATKLVFPIGEAISWNWATVGPRERAAAFRTMGHVPWMRTHRLSAPNLSTAEVRRRLVDTKRLDDAKRDDLRTREDADCLAFNASRSTGPLKSGWRRSYSSGALLETVEPQPEVNEAGITPDCPFWVVQASRDVVDGHNGIFRTVFLDFLRQVLDDVIR